MVAVAKKAARGAADIFLRKLDERREERRQLQLDVPNSATVSIGPSRRTAAARVSPPLTRRCRVVAACATRPRRVCHHRGSARRGARRLRAATVAVVGRHDIGRHTRRWLAAAQWRLGGGAKTPQVPVERSAHLFVSLRSCSVKTIRSIDAAACHAHALRTRRARARCRIASRDAAPRRRRDGGDQSRRRSAPSRRAPARSRRSCSRRRCSAARLRSHRSVRHIRRQDKQGGAQSRRMRARAHLCVRVRVPGVGSQ